MVNLHQQTARDVTGVILAGGRSRRMGRDKATLPLDGQPLFERALLFMQGFFEKVIIAGDRPDLARPGVPYYPDLFPGSALGGLYTGLVHSPTPWAMVTACDMPWPNPELLFQLLGRRTDVDVVVPRNPEALEPLFALYHKNCLPVIKRYLERKIYCIFDFFPEVRVACIDWPEPICNINTPGEYQSKQQKGNQVKPVLSVVAKSGTGKTTLLVKLITELKARGYRVGTIKHDVHKFEIDHEGKDSWRLTQAGADIMFISSPAKLAMVKQNPGGVAVPLEELIGTYFNDVDLILTEGFKKSKMPKIEVHREERSKTLICRGEENDPSLIAVVSDTKMELDVPVFDLNDVRAVTDFIVQRFLS